MKPLLEYILTWISHATMSFSALANKLPDFMIGYLLELIGVLLASIFVAIFSILFIDKKKEIQKVKTRVLDLRLEQYEDIRAFVATQRKITAFPENIENVKYNLELSGLYLEGNENHYSSLGLATEQNINKSLAELENLIMNGLYILDDDVLGMLLQVKIYIMNLNMFSNILRGYYDHKQNGSGEEDIKQISELYFHHLSILLNVEYQKMIEKLQEMVIYKASKPRFERKDKDYRKIKTRKRLQNKALNKTILITKFPQLLHALASLSSAYFQESEEERDNTLKEFFTYAVNIIEW